MARSSPQSFQKRQRERRKQEKREEKFERRLIRNEEKRRAKEEGIPVEEVYVDAEEFLEGRRRDEFEGEEAPAEEEEPEA